MGLKVYPRHSYYVSICDQASNKGKNQDMLGVVHMYCDKIAGNFQTSQPLHNFFFIIWI